MMSGTIWTIGHSNRDLDAFLDLLRSEAIDLLADVRRFPGSRTHPHFSGEALKAALAGAGIAYRHFAGLGGRRGKPRPNSPNVGWRVASFNAYADHMDSPDFRDDFETLVTTAEDHRVTLMCSEAVPWRCHRRLIADALVVRGWKVRDILGPGQARDHVLTPFARVVDGRLIYPAPPVTSSEAAP
jgi:uncharacterized protein (DUF488 family)